MLRMRTLPRRLLLLALGSVICLLPACSTLEGSRSTTAIEHIVFVWLKRPGDKGDRERLVAAALRLDAEIRELRGVRSGVPVPSSRPMVDDTFDVAFLMRFDSAADLVAYEKNAQHAAAVRDLLKPLSRRVLVYDVAIRR